MSSPSVQIKRDRSGTVSSVTQSTSRSARRPTISTSTNTPTPASMRIMEETSDGGPTLRGVVDGLPLREEPDEMEGGRVDNGRRINDPDLTGQPLRINTNNLNVPSTSNHTPSRRNRSRTIDCILGSPVSPLPSSSLSTSTATAGTANRNRTGTISRGPTVSSPIIENETEDHPLPQSQNQSHPVTSTSVDLVLPESTKRDLKLKTSTSDSISASSTGSGHRKSVSSHREPALDDEYKYPPPLRISDDRNRDRDRGDGGEGGLQTGRARARTGSVSWFKQTLGMGDAGKVDEEMGLTGKDKRNGNDNRDNRRSSSSKGDDDEGTEARERRQEEEEEEEEDVHRDEVVDHLNVIDAQVSAVTYLQDAANSIMIPPIPSLFKSKATITLDTPSRPTNPTRSASTNINPSNTNTNITANTSAGQQDHTDSSSESDEEDLLDTHVKDVLASKRRSPKKEWFIRSMKGAWAFVKTPIGVITAIYGFLVVFWGAAIVLFLLGWIDTGSKENKDKWVEISSQVTNGLFTVTGVGFIPWRVRDAYRISAIWRLQHIDRNLRKKRGLEAGVDKNQAPDPEWDEDFVQVLTDKQQARLKYQQRAFGKSQTWYRPHETDTHRAFSLNFALWICLFTIGNSVFQCFLCGTMWGLNRHERPAWTTGTLIPLSFLCGIASAVLIWKGQQRSKKTAEVEKKLRDALGMEDEGEHDSEEKAVRENVQREVV